MKSQRRTFNPAIALSAMLLTTLACQAAGATPTPGFGDLQTMVAATLQAGPGQFTAIPTYALPTAFPTGTPIILNTATSQPTATKPAPSLPNAQRINFVTGTTQSVTSGTIGAGQVLTYVIRAMQGQAVIASADSPSGQIDLAIFGANGVVLLPAAQDAGLWSGTLPATQDYYFQVIGGSVTETFSMDVVIAARIQFDPGTIKTTLKGRTVNGYPVTYVAWAQKGQKMDVTLTVPGDSAAITIWGLTDGVPYARAQNGVQDFSFDLTFTQDYMIEVVPKAGQVVDYTLLVRIK